MSVILVGDVREQLKTLPAESVHMVCTSPPYWGLRDYGTAEWEGGDTECDHNPPPTRYSATSTLKNDGRRNPGANNYEKQTDTPYRETCGKCGARRVDAQLGLEATIDEYITNMVGVFREVRRVLRDDGTLWLNMGDGYNGSASQGGPSDKQMSNAGSWHERGREKVPGLKPKDLIGQPWLLAKALQAPYYTGRIAKIEDRAWLAAIVDGEGCITANAHRRKDDGRVRTKCDVFITNSSVPLLDRVSEIWPANRRRHERGGPGHIGTRQCYRWWPEHSEDVSILLREIYPHLVAKRRQALLGWNLVEFMRDGRRLGKSQAAQEVRDKRELLVRLIQRCNKDDSTVDIPSWCAEPPSLFEPGWYLRSDVIWAKPNPMPESVTDRPTKSHEHLFLLSKRPTYYYDSDAIREASTFDAGTTRRAFTSPRAQAMGRQPSGNEVDGWVTESGYRNKRDVWSIAHDEDAMVEWTSAIGFCRRCGGLRVAGNGSAPTTDKGMADSMPSTEPSPTNSKHTESPMRYSSGQSPTGLPLTTSAATEGASIQPTSSPSPSEKTSCEETPPRPETQQKPTARRATPIASQTLIDALVASGNAVHACDCAAGGSAPKSDVWRIATQAYSAAHFATFPTALVRPCVLAGTSERGCCAECGAPWVREVERGELVGTDRGGNYNGRDIDAGVRSNPGTPGLSHVTRTTGWRPSCDCGADVVPATILDPFLGSGTTGQVAHEEGRAFVGCELNPEYAALAERRIEALQFQLGL